MSVFQLLPRTAWRVTLVLFIVLVALGSSRFVSVLARPGLPGPTVTIDQNEEQPDPTDSSPIVFTVMFSEPVTGFETGDVALSGTAGATTATVFDSGDSTFFLVAVSGMTANGTVIANVPAGVATNLNGDPNVASTSSDNTVTFTGIASSAVLVVTKTADSNDGSCDADCSLREAIVAANTNPGANTIAFNIPASDPACNATTKVCTISVSSLLGNLPQITDQVTIDGYTQGTISTPANSSDDATPNTHALAQGLNTRLLIELTDDVVGVTGNGLDLRPGAVNSRIRGLSIYGFSASAAINVTGVDGCSIEGNFLGVRADGSSALANNYGVTVTGSLRTTIGGLTPASSNLISGNGQAGVLVTGVTSTEEDRNTVSNNLIGTNSLGLLGLPNAESAAGVNKGGVLIVDASGVQVGGVGIGNVISGNNGIGVIISRSAPGGNETKDNMVLGNLIGVTANGASALANSGDGIEISNAQTNVIGGADANQGNTISNNTANGIAITGLLIVGSESNDNLVASNSISANGMDGVLVTSGIGNRINGNSSFGNAQEGIDLLGDGVTANDTDDVDPITGPNANNLQNYPVISFAASNSLGSNIDGTLDGGVPGTTYQIEFFSNPTCDGTNGEGQTVLGSITTAPSDANGDVSFTFHTNAVLVGQVVTATATDNTTNDTSEFSACFTVLGDIVAPTVTINQAAGQSDPTTSAPINFTIVFSEPVNGFETGDVTFFGTAGPTTAIVTGSGATYNVAIAGMTQSGTVTATIGAGVATDAAGNPNTASTSTDNTVTFNIPGQIQFKSSTFSVNENGTAASIVVTRTGGSGGQVSATFNTSNGTATAGADYTAVNSFVVTFADGDTADKTVTVPITDDTMQEPDETVNLALTNPTGGAALGSPNTATLTIVDNDLPTVQFSPANYSVTEDCTFVTITVTRAGDPSAPFTVHYASNPIQASERSDYTTAIGTLRFAAGETSASFALLISEDSLAEATEMLNINLGNPTGGVQLGAAGTATVAINDDGDTGTAANAIDDQANFVCQHYHDFLGRQADTPGQTFWTNQITSCGTDQSCITEKRTNVSAAFFLSVEFQQTGYFVMRIYKTAFGSQPDNPRYDTFIEDMGEVNRGVIVGQGNWEAQLEANQQAYALAFVSRPDFMASYPPGQTAAQFVDALFHSAGVTPTAGERQAAINAYGSGDANGRAASLRSIVESDSIYNALYNPGFVLMEYYGYLRRNPNDPPDDASFSGYNFWLNKMNSFTLPGENARDEQVALSRVRRAQMVLSFILSAEYRQRFGQ
jgi:CSLREA domain-containing protein